MHDDNTPQQLERNADGQLFNETALHEELTHEDPFRRNLAHEATTCLLVLAECRSRTEGIDMYAAFKTVFDAEWMHRDMNSTNTHVSEVALEAFTKLGMLAAIRTTEDMPPSLDEELIALEILARTRAKLREMDRANGRPTTPLD